MNLHTRHLLPRWLETPPAVVAIDEVPSPEPPPHPTPNDPPPTARGPEDASSRLSLTRAF